MDLAVLRQQLVLLAEGGHFACELGEYVALLDGMVHLEVLGEAEGEGNELAQGHGTRALVGGAGLVNLVPGEAETVVLPDIPEKEREKGGLVTCDRQHINLNVLLFGMFFCMGWGSWAIFEGGFTKHPVNLTVDSLTLTGYLEGYSSCSCAYLLTYLPAYLPSWLASI